MKRNNGGTLAHSETGNNTNKRCRPGGGIYFLRSKALPLEGNAHVSEDAGAGKYPKLGPIEAGLARRDRDRSCVRFYCDALLDEATSIAHAPLSAQRVALQKMPGHFLIGVGGLPARIAVHTDTDAGKGIERGLQ